MVFIGTDSTATLGTATDKHFYYTIRSEWMERCRPPCSAATSCSNLGVHTDMSIGLPDSGEAVRQRVFLSREELASDLEDEGLLHLSVLIYRRAWAAGHREARFGLARLLWKTDAWDEARPLLKEEWATSRNEGALSLLRSMTTDAATRHDLQELLREDIRTHGPRPAALFLADLQLEAGNDAEAERLWRESLRAGDTRASVDLANFLRDRGALDEAQALYMQALQEGDLLALWGFGVLFRKRGDNEGSIRSLMLAAAQGYIRCLPDLLASVVAHGGDSELAVAVRADIEDSGSTEAPTT